MKKHLLPSGFFDVLPPDAGLETRVTNRLLGHFAKYGYEQVKPPLLEFEENIITDKQMARQAFRFVDPLSQETVALRADMTGQIARIAATRLDDKPLPLRICYSGQVLRVNQQGAYPERQLVQSGLELIGSESPLADAEAIIVAVSALKKLRIKNLNIDFNLPSLLKAILDKSGLNGKNRETLLQAINKKDYAGIELAADKKTSAEIIDIMDLSGEAENCIKALAKKFKDKKSLAQLKHLQEVIKAIRKEDAEINLTLDPLEMRGFDYHSGITFSIFTPKSIYELGRGGRYEITRKSGKVSATGVTIYVNSVLRALPKLKNKPKVLLSPETSSASAKKLREENSFITIMCFENSNLEIQAKNLGCDYIFINGKLKKIV